MLEKKALARIIRIVIATVSIILSLMAFGTGFEALGKIFILQLGPDIVRLFTSFSVSLLFIVLGILLFTLFFGRFYCAVICPLGILQDFTCFMSRRKFKAFGNYYKTRYIIAAVAFGLLLGGWAVGFKLLEPFSNFGTIATTAFTPLYTWIHNLMLPDTMITQRTLTMYSIITGLMPLVILTALVVWKKRVYCTAICPVGTLLGLCSKCGVLRLSINENCVSCGKCANVCPSACIDYKEKKLDNERCTRCMNCVATCPVNAVKYGVYKTDKKKAAVDNTRRNFLISGVVAFAAAIGTASGALIKPNYKSSSKTKPIIPPGAGTPERFASKCTSCKLCVVNCRGNALRASNSKFDTIHLEFDKGMCEFNCNICGQICPTGAIIPMDTKTKRRHRIGLAKVELNTCIAVQTGENCGACAEHCPTGALRMVENSKGIRVPEMTKELCIGCGGCEFPCPVVPVKAVRVYPVTTQVSAADPAEYHKKQMDDSGRYNDVNQEWLI